MTKLLACGSIATILTLVAAWARADAQIDRDWAGGPDSRIVTYTLQRTGQYVLRVRGLAEGDIDCAVGTPGVGAYATDLRPYNGCLLHFSATSGDVILVSEASTDARSVPFLASIEYQGQEI